MRLKHVSLLVLLIALTAGCGDAPGQEKKLVKWQELQDLLASKGMPTHRGPGFDNGATVMWFLPGKGDPIKGGPHYIPTGSEKEAYKKGAFSVEPHLSDELAKQLGETIKDRDQRDDFIVWRNFILRGSDEKRAELKKALQ